jgi:hypothetical protein
MKGSPRIQIRTDAYQQQHGKPPHGKRDWIFATEDGRWICTFHCGFGRAQVLARHAYKARFATDYGILNLQP